MRLLSSRAFTLVELMIVLAIIGILAAALFPQMTGFLERARDTGRIADLNNSKANLQIYNAENGAYPQPADGAAGNCFSDSNGNSTNDAIFQNTYSKKKLPTDPQSTRLADPCATAGSYGYKLIDSNANYMLWAHLENAARGNLDLDDITAVTGLDGISYTSTGSAYIVTP